VRGTCATGVDEDDVVDNDVLMPALPRNMLVRLSDERGAFFIDKCTDEMTSAAVWRGGMSA